MNRKLSLSEYIQKVGPQVAADRWGMKVRTVESWKRHERYPRPEQARVIVANSPVTMDGIYGERA